MTSKMLNDGMATVKLTLFLFAVLGASSSSAATLTNPDFETHTGTQDDGTTDAFTGWTVTINGSGTADSTATAQTGSSAVKLTTAAGGQDAYVSQILSVTAGNMYAVSYYTRAIGGSAGRYSFYDLTGSASIASGETGVSGTAYTVVNSAFVAPVGCTSVSISLLSPGVFGPDTAYFDNLTWREGHAPQGTYYFDHTAGADSNAGSQASPMKRHPYMVGFAGAYVHVAGDRFMFKGGETWPRSVLPLVPTLGGSSGSVHDYYGATNTFYTGGSWARPIFDFEQTQIGDLDLGGGIQIRNINYITLDNLELKRFRQAQTLNTGCGSIVLVNTASYINILNCLVYDWDMPANPTSGQDGGGGGGIVYTGAGTSGGIMVSNCVLHLNGVAMKTGSPLSIGGTICYNTVSNTATGYLGGGVIHNNHIHHLQTPTDPIFHPNGILTQNGTATIFSNRLHDLSVSSEGIYCDTGLDGTTPGTNLLYGNYLNHSKGVSADIHNGDAVGMRMLNNTIVNPDNAACVRVSNSGSGESLSHLEMRNNWFITTGTVVTFDTNVINLIANYNLTNSAATANSYGAVAANYYQPTNASSPTIDTGTNLLSYFTRNLPFDVGAFEFTSPTATTLNIHGTLRVGTIVIVTP